MKSSHLLLRAVSYCGLALSIVPAVLVFTGHLSNATYMRLMIVGMVLWFATAVLWVKPDQLGE